MLSKKKSVRPQADAADGPGVILFGAVLLDSFVDKTVLELLELQLQVRRSERGVAGAQALAPVLMHPLEMHGIDRVLLALKPVAGHLRNDDLRETVSP